MRASYPALVTALAATLCSTLLGQPPDANQVLAGAREALGGEKTLSAVKSFVATGRTRQVRGNNLVPIEFEISCELPDKFVRKDEIPAQDTDLTMVGFKGDELIQFPLPRPGQGPGRGRAGDAPPGDRAGAAPAPNGGRAGGPPEGGRGMGGNPAQQRLTTVKQDFVRLTLGAFATSFPVYPLTFKYAAQGEAPEGKADVLEVAGPANFSARLVVQRETRLPVMLMWQGPAANVAPRPPGPPAPDAAPGQAPPQATPVEHRIYYADFRDVGGMKWPFRIRRAVAGETIEETTFDRIRINVRIDPRKFEVPK